MSRSRVLRVVLAGAFACFGLAGCGGDADRSVVAYKKGEYQGKKDSKPWDNEPNTWSASKWTKGDQASWENAIKQRAANQNEYARAE